jgi:hypothetical protein
VSPVPDILSEDAGTPNSYVPSYYRRPFTKWGIDFTTCHLVSARGHRYIIVAVDYFTKWVEAMPTFNNDGETVSFLFSIR